MSIIIHAVDTMSLKLNGICLFLLVIDPSSITTWLALGATVSTIIYNSIRIFKEVKQNKKND